MSNNWSRIDNGIRRHYKVLQLGVMINRPGLAHRYVIDLICWLSEGKPDGCIAGLAPIVIAHAALLEPELDAAEFIRALYDAGIVDPDGKMHDWDDYQGARIEYQEREAERKRKFREKQSGPRQTTLPRLAPVSSESPVAEGAAQDVPRTSRAQSDDTVRGTTPDVPRTSRATSDDPGAGQTRTSRAQTGISSDAEHQTPFVPRALSETARGTSAGRPAVRYGTVRTFSPLTPSLEPVFSPPLEREALGVGGEIQVQKPTTTATNGNAALAVRPVPPLAPVPTGDVERVWRAWAEIVELRGARAVFGRAEARVLRDALERNTAEDLVDALLGVAGDAYWTGRALPSLAWIVAAEHVSRNVQRKGDRTWRDPRPRSRPPPVLSPPPAPLPSSDGPRKPLSELLAGETDNEFMRGFLRNRRDGDPT